VKTRNRKPCRSNQSEGVCLTEAMIAIAAGAVVVSAALQAMDHFQGRLWKQIKTMDAQQEVRVGLKILTDEVRLAGTGGPPSSPSLVIAEPQEIKFLANLDGLATILTAPVLSDALQLPVQNGDDWPNGKRVLVCQFSRCRESHLARAGQPTTLSLTDSLGQPFAAGHRVVVSNAVRYYLGKNRDGQPTLMRDVDGGANPLIANVLGFWLSYFDANGSPTTDPSRMVRVNVQLAVARGRLITTDVHLRSGI
jgi:hypothetical protein